ncbi:MAG: peptide ABC transporter substrate-binding protein [Candidatus Zambryskibacteria bacterium]|nr:peptide ABC transporter substrate-binding protein [Candidatus Zambryskibacteria bacterium]
MRYKELQALLRRRFQIPRERSVRRTIQSFTLAEKAVFYFFTAFFILSGFSLIWQVSNAYLVQVPTEGGALTEGVVGNPRFINPVLALSEADKNLTALIYSGLLRVTPQGEIINNLAEKVSISENRLVYTVTIASGARFHDGIPVTADDVVFTVSKITDPLIKSPRRGNWDGVIVEKVDERTVRFTLKKAYTPFIYNLTTGILPHHIWKNVTDDEFSFSQFNTLPVGSGPYKIGRVERNDGGIPDYYRLSPFKGTLAKTVFVRNLSFRFYPSETALIEAYKKGGVESIAGISPERLSELNLGNAEIISAPLPRIFAVFFNQSQSRVLLNKEVREALDMAAPKEKIVEEVLGGYGTAIDGPLPATLFSWVTEHRELSSEERMVRARKLLTENGWKPNDETGVLEKKSGNAKISLSFSISTGDAPELRLVSELLKASWQELGAEVEVLYFESGELNQSVIRPRHFDALLFGEVVGREADLYPFWHSSQRSDPGLNIALYANSRTDRLLEEIRTLSNKEEVEESYNTFYEELKKDMPAVFLYSPSFLYIVPEKLKGVELISLSVSQDRFLNIRDWFVETDKVWKIFLD